MSAGERHRGRLEFQNVAIAFWIVASFIAFGLLSNFIDNESVLYNLGQGAFVSLFVGALLFIASWVARGRKKG
jgi:uncharacterized membrane protein YraQ (UPF0718 family)